MNLAIYASGSGTNAEELIRYFRGHGNIRVGLVVTNKANAGVRAKAEAAGIPSVLLPPEAVKDGHLQRDILQSWQIDAIALAGYLKLVPAALVQAYPDRIFNIHPALLPKFGGPGMYGIHVHQAVLAAGEAESGCTIHLVNEHYDEGRVLAQGRVAVQPGWTAEQLQQAVLAQEHQLYAPTIERFLINSAQ
jgi:phosphoribosylglycinamide formyltransferase-1